MSDQDLLVITAVSPLVCLAVIAVYLQRKSWQIYRRIGNYSIGLMTFFIQLEYEGWNFPGPNVLEAQLAKQPVDLQVQVQVFRRRIRYLRWSIVLYIGFLLSTLFLVRELSA
jgi:hypothetical protein